MFIIEHRYYDSTAEMVSLIIVVTIICFLIFLAIIIAIMAIELFATVVGLLLIRKLFEIRSSQKAFIREFEA